MNKKFIRYFTPIFFAFAFGTSTFAAAPFYGALAYGITENAQGLSYGFYVRGYGNTHTKAESDALNKCINMGYACRIVD